MTILEALSSLGFSNAEDLGACPEDSSLTIVRVMTSKGWTYERFATADDVKSWAEGKIP